MKNLIKIGVLNALIIAGACQTSLINAHPLETLMPFVTRILLNSKSYLESAPGLWIKMLAQPYGLQCKYPVLISKNSRILGAAYSFANHKLCGIQPNKDALGRVIFDITDKRLVKSSDEQIVFNHNFVKEWSTKNPLALVSILLHENKHLDAGHFAQKITLKRQNFYAGQHKLDLVLPNGIVIMDKSDNYYCYNKSIQMVEQRHQILCEEEADSVLNKHPDLCRAALSSIGNTKKALFKSDLACLKRLKKHTTMDKISLFERYRKVCLQDREAYEYLEHKYQLSHPLGIRRINYLEKWANDAEKNQTQEHPTLSDALLDYCTRNLTEFRKPTS